MGSISNVSSPSQKSTNSHTTFDLDREVEDIIIYGRLNNNNNNNNNKLDDTIKRRKNKANNNNIGTKGKDKDIHVTTINAEVSISSYIHTHTICGVVSVGLTNTDGAPTTGQSADCSPDASTLSQSTWTQLCDHDKTDALSPGLNGDYYRSLLFHSTK